MINRNSNLPFLLIVLVILITSSPVLAEDNLARIIKNTQPSVVSILTYNKDGKLIGQGSGFFIEKQGAIVTNYHVIQGTYRMEVKVFTGQTYTISRVLAEDKGNDLVLLRFY